MWIIAHFLVLPSTCALLPSPPPCVSHFTFPEKLGNLSKSARYSYLSGGHARQTDRWTGEGERGQLGRQKLLNLLLPRVFPVPCAPPATPLRPYLFIWKIRTHTHTHSLACSSFLLKVSRPRCTPATYSAYCMRRRREERGKRGCGFAKGLWADDGGVFRAASLNRASKNLYVLCCYMCYKFLSAPPSATPLPVAPTTPTLATLHGATKPKPKLSQFQFPQLPDKQAFGSGSMSMYVWKLRTVGWKLFSNNMNTYSLVYLK